MFGPPAAATRNCLKSACFTALCVVAIARPALPLAAQQGGPLPAPPAGTITASGPATQSSTGPREPTSHIINEPPAMPVDEIKIGRASCRERGEISVVAGSLKKKNK